MTDPFATDPPRDDEETLARQSPISADELEGMNDEELTALVRLALRRLSVEGLNEVMQLAEEQRRDRQEEVRNRLLERFRREAAEEGVSFDALFPSYGYAARRTGSGQTGPVKYRSPTGETWTGRGRKPKWFADLEHEGHNLEELRVG